MIGMQVFIIYWANPIRSNGQVRMQVKWKELSQGLRWRFWLNFQTKELFILNLRKQNHLCLLELPLIGARYNKLVAGIMFPVEGEIIYSMPLFSFSLSVFEFNYIKQRFLSTCPYLHVPQLIRNSQHRHHVSIS